MKFTKPQPMKMLDKRVKLNGLPIKVDFRIISEDGYQDILQLLRQANCGWCHSGIMQPDPVDPGQEIVYCEWCKKKNEILE